MVHRELTTLEAVALAVRSEIESTHLYADLAKRVKNPAVCDVLKQLAADEEHHRQSLMELYESMLGGEEPSIPETDGREKNIELSADAEYRTVIVAARDKERDSEEFYRNAADRVRDHKTRMFFLDVAESERAHAATLQQLADRLQEDPHCFDREDADPFKPMHVGP
jgi:rubrerythrin